MPSKFSCLWELSALEVQTCSILQVDRFLLTYRRQSALWKYSSGWISQGLWFLLPGEGTQPEVNEDQLIRHICRQRRFRVWDSWCLFGTRMRNVDSMNELVSFMSKWANIAEIHLLSNLASLWYLRIIRLMLTDRWEGPAFEGPALSFKSILLNVLWNSLRSRSGSL